MDRGPAALEIRGPAGSEVYLDATFRGRIRPNGILVVEGLSSGTHKLSVDAPGAPTHEQNISLSSPQTFLDLQAAFPANASSKSSPLVAQIRQASKAGQLLEPNGAWALYQQLVRTAPAEPQRKALELELRAALEEVLTRFAPQELAKRLTEQSMLDDLLPMNRKAKLWDLFLERHAAISGEAREDFNAAFGRAFRRAYEAQVKQLRGERG